MSRFDPTERRSEDLIGAIHDASHHIATAITQGFKLMADAQTTALSDLNTAVAGIADAIAGAIGALQAAVSAAQNLQPDDSAAIEAEVTKLNDLTSALKTATTPPVAPTTSATAVPTGSATITSGGTSSAGA